MIETEKIIEILKSNQKIINLLVENQKAIIERIFVLEANQNKTEIIPDDKYLTWEEEWQDHYTWEYFNDNFFWCDFCKSYQEGICVCFAR